MDVFRQIFLLMIQRAHLLIYFSANPLALSYLQFDNQYKFMVPMLLNFPEDSWVAIDNLTKVRSQNAHANRHIQNDLP